MIVFMSDLAKIQRKAFEFMLQMVVIIGAPAFAAAFYGRKIGLQNGTHPRTMIILMLAALAFSWIIIIIKFLKINKELKKK